jgi:hypothetical protein
VEILSNVVEASITARECEEQENDLHDMASGKTSQTDRKAARGCTGGTREDTYRY